MNQIDDLLHAVESEKMRKMGNIETPIEIQSLSVEPTKEEPINTEESINVENEINQYVQEQNQQEEQINSSEKEEKGKTSQNVDEYGNPINKDTKMYSAEEVQKMIRERLSRVKSEKPHQSYQEQSVDTYQNPNQNTPQEDSWEAQLEHFIDKRLQQKQIEIERQKWQQKEAQKQYEFEQKFTSGMTKYQDFHDVVAGKPITDSMMLGIRNLENPASFVYGASKMHPAELDRISRIEDPYIQASEMGKLHERMVKDRKKVSTAPKPAEIFNGDLGLKNSTQIPTNINSSDYQSYITSRIDSYAKQKRRY